MEPPCIRLRALTRNDWRLFREVRLAALREAGLREATYAFGSTLGDWQGPNDTEDRSRQRLTNVPFNVVVYFNLSEVCLARKVDTRLLRAAARQFWAVCVSVASPVATPPNLTRVGRSSYPRRTAS